MRLLTLAFIAIAFVCLPAVAFAAEGSRIAVVDVERLLAESSAGKSIQRQLKSRQETFQKEFSNKEKELSAAQEKLIEDQKSLSADEFAAKRKEFEEKIFETRKLFQQRRTNLDQSLGEAMRKLRSAIAETAATVADREGYDVLLTRDSVVIVEKKLDITSAVLKELNTQLNDISLDK